MLVPQGITDIDSVREFMTIFIMKRYREILGDDVLIIDQPFGLDILAEKYLGR